MVQWKCVEREISVLSYIRALLELISFLKYHKDADVIHLHSSKAGFLGRISARLLGLQDKVIYTPHGASFLRKDVSRLKKIIFICLEKIASWMGGVVVACSASEKRVFRSYKIPAMHIYNGIRCKNGLKDATKKEPITIGTVARISAPKYPSLFNKISEFYADDPLIEFLWVGDGEFRKELTSSNIRVTGWVSSNEVWPYLSGIDIYLSTSLWEGLPLSVLQAMCSGKPLVLSKCVGNVDLVDEGFNGFLFDNELEARGKIDQLIGDLDLRFKYAANSRKLYEREFTLENMINKYYDLYAEVSGVLQLGD
jgi:glycosyltransferase involved in cell wall biosynthesis